MSTSLFQEFKPTIYFLLRFLGLFVVSNVIYGLFISTYGTAPDPVTEWVTNQAAIVLNIFGWDVSTLSHAVQPTTSLRYAGKNIVAIYEGCNGVNIYIIFIAFLVAIGPFSGKLVWFSLLGAVIIHISNVFRIVLLFQVTIQMPKYVYFVHKYLFTAIIYGVVFLLWFWWLKMNRPARAEK